MLATSSDFKGNAKRALKNEPLQASMSRTRPQFPAKRSAAVAGRARGPLCPNRLQVDRTVSKLNRLQVDRTASKLSGTGLPDLARRRAKKLPERLRKI